MRTIETCCKGAPFYNVIIRSSGSGMLGPKTIAATERRNYQPIDLIDSM